jgi:hypothetical protein
MHELSLRKVKNEGGKGTRENQGQMTREKGQKIKRNRLQQSVNNYVLQ